MQTAANVRRFPLLMMSVSLLALMLFSSVPVCASSIQFSVVVPTYKEAGNIEPLCVRLFAALEERWKQRLGGGGSSQLTGTAGVNPAHVELMFVDDNSQDGTDEIVQAQKRKGYNIRLLVRKEGQKGLSSAVLHGLLHSNGEYLAVMDADLQHPPETVPLLFEHLLANKRQRPPHHQEREGERERGGEGIEFVLGSRYPSSPPSSIVGLREGKDSSAAAVAQNWPLHRRIVSWGARLLARPLTALSDPMSGFFALRRSVFQRGYPNVDPIGYKIGLELFVKCGVDRFDEVGYNFSTRTVGESKLSAWVMISYLWHLVELYRYVYGLPVLVIGISCIVALSVVAGRRLALVIGGRRRRGQQRKAALQKTA